MLEMISSHDLHEPTETVYDEIWLSPSRNPPQAACNSDSEVCVEINEIN